MNDNTITIAVITGMMTAIPSIIATVMSQRKSDILQTERISVIQKEISELSGRVEKHNNYGIEIPQLKVRIDNLEKRVDSLERR